MIEQFPLAQEGMERAAAHAERVEPDWNDRAYDLLCAFARTRPEFHAEEARAWAVEQGLPTPPDNRAWGWPTKRAVKEGVLQHDRYEAVKIAPSHGRPMPVWKSLIYLGGRA